MEDGVIKNICPSDNETQESLNLKKAILSMLQVQYSGLADFLPKTVYFIRYIETLGMGPEISQVKGTITSKKIFMENASQTMNSLV